MNLHKVKAVNKINTVGNKSDTFDKFEEIEHSLTQSHIFEAEWLQTRCLRQNFTSRWRKHQISDYPDVNSFLVHSNDL
jgi:hypothetical protein